MSSFNPTLSILGITDTNIHVTDAHDEYRGNGVRRHKVHAIACELTYKLIRCPLCGFETLRPNGHKLTHIHVNGATETPTVLDLNKQRWLCESCHHSIMATSPLVTPNHSIAQPMIPRVLKLAKQRLTVKVIGKIVGISASSVQRILNQYLNYHPARHVPINLCFDEFRATNNHMAFICLNGDSHQLVTLLPDRINRTIKDFFLAHYSLEERQAVQTVTMDMNAAYQRLIPEVFPNARIIIDRFHIVQILGRALDQVRISALKQIKDHHLRTYKVMKSQWRLFHKVDPDAAHVRYFMGLNEYMTEQNALDLAFDACPKLRQVYELYIALHQALMTHDTRAFWQLLDTYRPTGTAFDTAITTLKQNQAGVLAATISPRSNGPLEGINRLIKSLKRSCFGFTNQGHFFDRIYQITA